MSAQTQAAELKATIDLAAAQAAAAETPAGAAAKVAAHSVLTTGIHGATATPTANRIPIAGGDGKLDEDWLPGGGGGTSDHAALLHLAYADAGHSGFAPTVHAHQTPWPVLTTTQMNALTPTEGSVCWNTTEHQLMVYDGSAWVGIPMLA